MLTLDVIPHPDISTSHLKRKCRGFLSPLSYCGVQYTVNPSFSVVIVLSCEKGYNKIQISEIKCDMRL